MNAALNIQKGIDDISPTSGISRGTIYKHWKQKDALCLDALNYMKRSWPVFNSGNPRADITGLLSHLALTRKPEAFTRVWPRVMSYSANNLSFAKAFRARVSEGRHAQLVQLLELAKSKGELRKDLNIGIAVDLLLGPDSISSLFANVHAVRSSETHRRLVLGNEWPLPKATGCW